MNAVAATTNIVRLPTIRKIIAAAVKPGPEDRIDIERSGGVEISIVSFEPYDSERDQWLTHGALDSQNRLRRVDRDATDALLASVKTALVDAGYDSFGGFRAGWGAWIINSDYRDPNPHNLDGVAHPMHY